jgi:class 3 adenylate cyclase
MDYWEYLTYIDGGKSLTDELINRIHAAAFRNGFLIPCLIVVIKLGDSSFFERYGERLSVAMALVTGGIFMHSVFYVYEGDPAFILGLNLIILDVQIIAFRWRLLVAFILILVYTILCIVWGVFAEQMHLLFFTIGVTATFILAVHGQEHFDHVSDFQLRQLQQHTDHVKQLKEIQWQLLVDLVPREIARQLIVNRGSSHDVIAEKYNDVTILFTDMKNFTAFSSKLDPADLATFLNTMFSSFDEILERFGLHKVEIIGDAYFVVSGAPATDAIKGRSAEEHAAFAAEGALAMVAVLPQICEDPNVSIRVGLHSGSVVGGVVGRKDPRFHLFGTNVEIANTMESLSEPNRVHITSDTYKRLRDLETSPPYSALTFAKNDIFDIKEREEHQQVPHSRSANGLEQTYFLNRSHFLRHFRMRQRREAAQQKGQLFRASKM